MRKVVLVDDEKAARQLLRQYLDDYPDWVIIGEANNGVDAISIIDEFKPDLVFLDVQMPGLTGFDVIQKIQHNPNIIFSTAFDQYALQAFEVNAVDYLLKPYTRERFGLALQRLLDAGSNNLKEIEKLAEHLLNNQAAQTSTPSTVLVQKGNKYVTINTADIIWIGAEKDYSRITTSEGKFLSNFGISALEEKLDKEDFLRVHRSSIINVHYIAEVYKNPSSYDIKMSNGDRVRVSRSYLDQIKRITF